MIEFSSTDIDNFHDALNSAKESMTADQQQLLRAILVFAWLAVEDEGKLMSGFSGSFTPEQGSLLADLAHREVNLRPQVLRGFIKLS
ncbi:hypothetical protein [Amycolatopsis sp. CA-126428]|uniref:hypothetical protein n=1 Tax=Amycolatopsis sp. CA-126428 TaxID=2073158 RepID=UPI0011B00F34|nr:hypothetical protein [Amycolatopsis sp. CA-126428]